MSVTAWWDKQSLQHSSLLRDKYVVPRWCTWVLGCKQTNTVYHIVQSQWWVIGQRHTLHGIPRRWPTGWSHSRRTPKIQPKNACNHRARGTAHSNKQQYVLLFWRASVNPDTRSGLFWFSTEFWTHCNLLGSQADSKNNYKSPTWVLRQTCLIRLFLPFQKLQLWFCQCRALSK